MVAINASNTFQEIGNVFHLWNVVLAVATVLDQQREYVIVLAARVRLIQSRQFVEHDAPRFDLLFGVLDVWQLLAVLVIERNVSKVFSVWRLTRNDNIVYEYVESIQ